MSLKDGWPTQPSFGRVEKIATPPSKPSANSAQPIASTPPASPAPKAGYEPKLDVIERHITFGIETHPCSLLNLQTMRDRYYTYIVASRTHVLYIGVTGNIERRIAEHRSHTFDGFTAKYRCNRLVWFERYPSPRSAIAREKELKGWRRRKKDPAH